MRMIFLWKVKGYISLDMRNVHIPDEPGVNGTVNETDGKRTWKGCQWPVQTFVWKISVGRPRNSWRDGQ